MRVIPTEMCIFLLDKGEKFSKFAVFLYLELFCHTVNFKKTRNQKAIRTNRKWFAESTIQKSEKNCNWTSKWQNFWILRQAAMLVADCDCMAFRLNLIFKECQIKHFEDRSSFVFTQIPADWFTQLFIFGHEPVFQRLKIFPECAGVHFILSSDRSHRFWPRFRWSHRQHSTV